MRKAANSFDRIFHHAKHTGVAATVLWQLLRSVLSSVNHEVRSDFEIRVTALLADIATVNSARRATINGEGGGAVVDWLLESVAAATPRRSTRGRWRILLRTLTCLRPFLGDLTRFRVF